MSFLEESFHNHLRVASARIEDSLTELGYESLILGAGESHIYFQDDEAAPFRVDRHFGWVCPVQGQGHFLRFTRGKKPLLVRCVPNSFWHENPPAPEAWWAGEFDIEEAESAAEAWKKLRDIPKPVFVGSQTVFATAGGVPVNSDRVLAHLDWWRSVKSSYEIENIVEANRIAAPGHRAAAQRFLDGGSEFDAMLAYLEGVGVSEKELSFTPIFAMDDKAATLHYEQRRHKKNGSVLLVDAGAVSRNYASDISRTTLAASAHPVFLEMWSLLNNLQQNVCREAVPGTSLAKMQLNTYRGILGILESVGILRGIEDADSAIRDGILRTFCPHGLGHSLGVCTHDTGEYSENRWGTPAPALEGFSFRANRSLEPGCVITVEPGIYFMPMLLQKMRDSAFSERFHWNLIDELVPFGGMRIEDDVLVTSAAPRNITREFLP